MPFESPARPRRGAMTVVEILIVVVLFSLVAGVAATAYVQSVTVERKIGSKLDLLLEAQVASLRMASALRHATEIFAPPEDLGQTRPYLVFSNDLNELLVLYVDEKKKLVLQNRTREDSVQVLASGVDRLRVFRKDRRLVNYHLNFVDAVNKESFDLISGICIRNNFN